MGIRRSGEEVCAYGHSEVAEIIKIFVSQVNAQEELTIYKLNHPVADSRFLQLIYRMAIIATMDVIHGLSKLTYLQGLPSYNHCSMLNPPISRKNTGFHILPSFKDLAGFLMAG